PGAPPESHIDDEALAVVPARIAATPALVRRPFGLKEGCEIPVADVAAALGIKAETVKTRVGRERLMVRRQLMAELPERPAPAPVYERQICLDLVAGKMDALDRGRGFPVPQDVLCERCRAVFAELDLAQSACVQMAEGRIPEALRSAVLDRLAQNAASGGA